ncbi:MAG: YkgJ family cysteine cluster protein [Pseudomonadota bacterium]
MLTVRTFTDIVLGQPIPQRACGPCVACCQLTEINEPQLKKPEGVLCPHCTGSACSIYDARPTPCRTYYCVWRRIAALPEEARPDRLGVMLHLAHPRPAPNPLMHVYISAQALTSWQDVSAAGFDAVLTVLKRSMLPVWRKDGDDMRLLHPSPAIARIILKGGKPGTRRVAAEAEEWLRIQSQY